MKMACANMSKCSLSIAYVIVHSIIANKKRDNLRQLISVPRTNHDRMSFSAVRLSVALCVLWLLTSGWDLIMAVRQTTCPPDGSGETLWMTQSTCVAHRIGTCIALLTLYDHCTLRCVLALTDMLLASLQYASSPFLPRFDGHLKHISSAFDESKASYRGVQTREGSTIPLRHSHYAKRRNVKVASKALFQRLNALWFTALPMVIFEFLWMQPQTQLLQ